MSCSQGPGKVIQTLIGGETISSIMRWTCSPLAAVILIANGILHHGQSAGRRACIAARGEIDAARWNCSSPRWRHYRLILAPVSISCHPGAVPVPVGGQLAGLLAGRPNPRRGAQLRICRSSCRRYDQSRLHTDPMAFIRPAGKLLAAARLRRERSDNVAVVLDDSADACWAWRCSSSCCSSCST